MGEVKARGLLCTWDFPAAGLALTLPLLLRTSRKTTKESLAQTSSSITESLMGISRVMSQQVQQSEEAMQTLGNVGGSRMLPPGGAAAEPLAHTLPQAPPPLPPAQLPDLCGVSLLWRLVFPRARQCCSCCSPVSAAAHPHWTVSPQSHSQGLVGKVRDLQCGWQPAGGGGAGAGVCSSPRALRTSRLLSGTRCLGRSAGRLSARTWAHSHTPRCSVYCELPLKGAVRGHRGSCLGLSGSPRAFPWRLPGDTEESRSPPGPSAWETEDEVLLLETLLEDFIHRQK